MSMISMNGESLFSWFTLQKLSDCTVSSNPAYDGSLAGWIRDGVAATLR